MPKTEELIGAFDAALGAPQANYQNAVLQLANREASKDASSDRELADVDSIHHARTRVIALDAAREELSRMIVEGVPLVPDR